MQGMLLNRSILLLLLVAVVAEKPHTIKIDGKFDDWDAVLPAYTDPDDAPDGSVLHEGIADCHEDETSATFFSNPPHVYNEDCNLLAYKVTHDNTGFYFMMRAKGLLNRTSVGQGSDAGRSYIQVAIDADNNQTTGYCLFMGGYFPSSCGFDLHAELELYNGSVNTAHYLLHAANDTASYNRSYNEALQGIVTFAPGATYHPYTEWVFWSKNKPMSADDLARCPDHHVLPNGDEICFVEDKTNGPFIGVMEYAFSADGHSVEFSAPFVGFMKHSNSKPAVGVNQVLSIALGLEVTGQQSTPAGEWATDFASLIRGYYTEEEPTSSGDATVPLWTVVLVPIFTFVLGFIIAYLYWKRQSQYSQMSDSNASAVLGTPVPGSYGSVRL